MRSPVLIGVAGGSGSGKTTVARELFRQFQNDSVTMIEQDSYYKNQDHLSMEGRFQTNYDHPLAFDNELLLSHLQDLLEGKAIEKPIYDFKEHTRKNETIRIDPKDVIIPEGGYNRVALDLLSTKISNILLEKQQLANR